MLLNIFKQKAEEYSTTWKQYELEAVQVNENDIKFGACGVFKLAGCYKM